MVSVTVDPKTRREGRPLNVAIIGCGAVGQREAAAVSSIPDLRLVAISDFGPAFRHLALQMGSQYGCDTVHDWRHLVARDDIDIVVVATPNMLSPGDEHRGHEAGEARPLREAPHDDAGRCGGDRRDGEEPPGRSS